MANSTPTAPKPRNVAQFPTQESAAAVAEPPEPGTEAIKAAIPAAFKEQPVNRGGRPRKTDPPVETEFFLKVAAVPAEDWGTRVYLYLYQLEPVCDLKQSGGKSYLMRYQEPIADEHRIMLEQGSGKYRLMLAKSKTGPEAGNAIGQYEFEIYNPQYPPRIPQEVWIKDPRNRRWEALLPKPVPVAPPGPASSVSEFVEVLKATNDIRRDIREEMQPAQQSAPAQPAAPAAPAADPFTAGIQIAQTLLQMRADNPMVDMMRDELKAMRDEIKSEREANRTLQTELRQAQAAPAATATTPAPKSLVDQVKDLMEIKSSLGSLFGAPADAAPAIRSGKMGWLDFASEVLPRVMEAPVMTALANRIMSSGPVPVNNPAAPPSANGGPDDDMLFVQHVVTPALLEFYQTENTGAAFAQHIHDGYPARLLGLQAYGEKTIFDLYKSRAPRPDWAILAARGEPAFALFIHEFVTWKPEPEDAEPGTPEVVDRNNGIIDLDPDDKEPAGS